MTTWQSMTPDRREHVDGRYLSDEQVKELTSLGGVVGIFGGDWMRAFRSVWRT